MYGVTQAKWDEYCNHHGMRRSLVHTISRGQAELLFFDEFWTKAGCETLFPGVDLAAHDALVNMGVSRVAGGWWLSRTRPAITSRRCWVSARGVWASWRASRSGRPSARAGFAPWPC